MKQILDALPDPELFLALEPEELGTKLLGILLSVPPRDLGNGMFAVDSLASGLFSSNFPNAYPSSLRQQIDCAVIEAFTWLQAQGLIVPAAGMNGNNGFRVLSRRARRFKDAAALQSFMIASRLPKEQLHETIKEKVWLDFIRGDYDTAVFRSMKQVEVNLREAISAGDDLLGVKLARAAFHPETGKLTDQAREGGEKQARMELFAGAIGSYKNPQSHRHVALSDPAEAIEQVLLANHLLRIIGSCKAIA